MEFIIIWFIRQGVPTETAIPLTRVLGVITIILLSILANFIAKRFIVAGLVRSVSYTKTVWGDIIVKRKVFQRLVYMAPVLVVYLLNPIVLAWTGRLVVVIERTVFVSLVIILVMVFRALLDTLAEIYNTRDKFREVPIIGFIQVGKLLANFTAGIIIVAIIMDTNPFFFLSGLGAFTAVLMLIFKDSLLGFVAGIQLMSNNMVARDDWIEMPDYGADGVVLEIALTTVKVRNFDNTITTIPTYALISSSFKNWRAMQESQGRRIKRSINIDLTSIKLCNEEMLDRFSKIRLVSAHLEQRRKEFADYNASQQIDDRNLINGKHMTNIGTFRAYLVAYLKEHPMINQDLTFLVRQLAPTAQGLPIEIYVFCKEKVWTNYEAIQSDIFDHILAIVPVFDLQLFQNPSGSDFRQMRK